MQPKRQPPLLMLHSSTSVGGGGRQWLWWWRGESQGPGLRVRTSAKCLDAEYLTESDCVGTSLPSGQISR